MTISINNRHPKGMVNPGAVKKRLGRIAPHLVLRKRVEISIIDDLWISELSGRYRGSPHPTDVLTFVYNDRDLAGEIAVSLDTAKRQSAERSVPLFHEILLLCVHGILHLTGLDDETYDKWCQMKIKEFEIMMSII